MDKKDFLAGLKQAGVEDERPEEIEKPTEQIEKAPEVPVAPPADPVAEKVETPAEPKVEAPPEPEPIKGWSLLSEETRTELKAKLDALEQTKADNEKKDRELRTLAGRVAPTQQQLSKAQLELVALQKKVQEFERKHQDSLSLEQKAKLEEYRANFPGEADLIENLTGQAFREAEEAKQHAATLAQRLDAIEQRSVIREELQTLEKAHPDWHAKRHSEDFERWRTHLDAYERPLVEQLLLSTKAADNIHVLDKFSRDQAWAELLRNQNGQPSHAPNPTTEAPAPAAPSVDPDPSRRATAPTQKSAGQPMSDKKREFIKAAEFLEQQEKLRAKRRA